ncbi:hypothetical protein D9613_012463 [Agrocybe pediades]|uniref:Uncharacterized protein n=1 Tax=Agrocybe pediades TaxID=84607 RepID=A0A8H4QRV4_9AGAR|nr:hypothetical protein D9613_012463 [Agrocybe pediades]
MTRSTTSSSTLVNLTHIQMLPSSSSQQQPTGKRKPEDSNPLLKSAVAKRAKKEAKLGASNKRKLNPEDGPGGLLIVRAAESQPPHSQPTTSHHAEPPRFASQQPRSNDAGPSKQPSKKFKAGADASTTRPHAGLKVKSTSRDGVAYPDEEQVENDVRAMEDEADTLRRKSRAHSTIPSSILNTNDSSLQFRTRTEPRTPNRSSGSSNNKGKEKVIDTIVPLPDEDTPIIDRNKQMRSGAMTAITGGSSSGNHTRPDHRRRSSVSGRGKRISTSFETTGKIVQPHNSVSENSFYKHIDADLPEPERVRQLLIWCSLRAASTSHPPSTPPSPPLPPLSAEGTRLLKTIQDDLVQMLAQKRIDVNTYSSADPSSSSGGQKKGPAEELRENEQNVRNRQWEVTYSQHIKQAQAEEEAWNKIAYEYDAYAKKLKSSLDKRSAGIHLDPGQQHHLSAKARGKRRATGDLADGGDGDMMELFVPHEYEIPHEFHAALRLANEVVGHNRLGVGGSGGGGSESSDRISGRRSSTTTQIHPTRTPSAREKQVSTIKSRLAEVPFKVDSIFSYLSAARTTVNIAEKALNERFDVLAANLASRVDPVVPSTEGAPPSAPMRMLETYVVAGPPLPGSSSSASGVGGNSGKANPLDLLRALSRIDKSRPPALVGDAARRAVREMQRAEENGVGAVGDRRLTLPPPPATPLRKTPGTPRRGGTPGR